MPKEPKVLKICDFVVKYIIYISVFLLPIFLLPQTIDVLDFNKQALLLLLVCVGLFAWMLKVLVSGKFKINKSPMHIVAGLMLSAYLLATIFSQYRYGSFWGMPQQISESMIVGLSLLLFYFLVSNVLSKKDILISAVILSFSAMIAEAFGVLQLLGLFILPFDFAKSVAFNTLGSVGSLGVFAAIIFPLAVVLLILAPKWWKILFSLEIIFSLFTMVLINYSVVWWVVIAGSACMLALAIIRKDLFDGRWVVLPAFFLATSLFLLIFHLQTNFYPQIDWWPQRTSEVSLSQRSGLEIVMQTLKEKPILGSGLGTFAYDFSKFKNSDFSKSSLWNITFNKPSSQALNDLATMGVFGFLALLALIVLPLFYAIKFLVIKEKQKDLTDSVYPILLLGLSVVLIEEALAFFLYSSNISLDFVYFFTIAALAGLIFEDGKTYVLKQSSLSALITTFIFTLIFIFATGLLILSVQRYVAQVYYYRALSYYRAKETAAGLKNLEIAASLNPESDMYFRQLSQAYLSEFQNEIQNVKQNSGATLSPENKTKIQTLVSNSINAAKLATDLNSQDVGNWSWRGYVYQSLFGAINDASIWAINSYEKALGLDPNNPYLFFQEGNVYLTQAFDASTSADQKNGLLNNAKSQLEKAINLRPNYFDAFYVLGFVYDALGQANKAVDAFVVAQQLNPADTDIPKILVNLRAGQPISQIIFPVAPNP